MFNDGKALRLLYESAENIGLSPLKGEQEGELLSKLRECGLGLIKKLEYQIN